MVCQLSWHAFSEEVISIYQTTSSFLLMTFQICHQDVHIDICQLVLF